MAYAMLIRNSMMNSEKTKSRKQSPSSIRNRNREGLSLIETIVAVLVFAIVISGSCGLIVQGKQLSDIARAHYTAVNLCKNRLEKARTFDFDQLDLFAEANVVVNASGSPDYRAQYRRSTTVTEINSNLVQFNVVVEIRNRVTLAFDGEQETLSSYIANYQEPPE